MKKTIHLMALTNDLEFRFAHLNVYKELETNILAGESATDTKVIMKYNIGIPMYGKIYYFDKENEQYYKKKLVEDEILSNSNSILKKREQILKHEQKNRELDILWRKL